MNRNSRWTNGRTGKDAVRALASASAVPDLAALRDELAATLSQAGSIRDRQTQAMHTRLCIWEGQSDDYRKHEEDLGEPAKPYEGAPDVRMPIVDMVAGERAALFVESLMSSEIQAKPIAGLREGENAAKMTAVLRWTRDNLLEDELRHEAELLANYVLGDDPGTGILKVWWKREPALELRRLTTDDVAEMLMGALGVELDPETGAPPEGMEYAIDEAADLIFNRAREDEALEVLAQAFGSVQPKRLRRALRELRKVGETDLPVPFIKENRPCVAALRYMQDIFFPPDLDDLQRARVLYEREWLSEAELRGRAHSEGWDQAFIDAVLEAGPGGGELDAYSLARPTFARPLAPAVAAETANLYEIWHAYARAADDYGISGVYWTVFSANVEDSWGYHELLDYPHGDYPFVEMRSEHISRGIENARGVAELAGSFQYEIKVQRDCRGAHTQIATLPPVRVAQRRGGLEAVLGPMVEIPVRDEKDVSWMTPPPFPQASIEMEKAAWSDLNQYFGRIVPGVPVELAQNQLQHAVNRWLGRWKVVWNHVQQLQQAYGDPVATSVVAGGPLQELTREEIRGRFRTSLAFNVRDLNMEFVISRNQAISAVLSHDLNGIVDRTPIVRAGLRIIDPGLATEAIREQGAVTEAEIRDEQDRVAKMAAGVEPPLRKEGINASLRLQTLVQTVNGSPTLARRYHAPANADDELFRKLVENEQKNLTFLIQQHQINPGIGLTGARQVTAGAPPAE